MHQSFVKRRQKSRCRLIVTVFFDQVYYLHIREKKSVIVKYINIVNSLSIKKCKTNPKKRFC